MAKKPSAAELKKQGDELKKKFGEMRKTVHNFAMQIGKEGIVFVADRKKPAEALWRAAKKDGGGSKGAKGQVTMKGKVMELDCDDPSSVPSGLARKAKVHFAERGQSAKVVIVGLEDEDDDEDATDENAETQEETIAAAPAAEEETSGGGADAAADGDAEETPGAASPEEDLRISLQREFDEIKPDIEASAESPNKGVAKKIGGLNTMFGSVLETDTKKARAILGLLQNTIKTAKDAGDIVMAAPGGGTETTGAPSQAAVERRSKLADLEKGVDDLLAEFA